MRNDDRGTRIREARTRLVREGPVWTRGPERDFETVTLPERDCDRLRDLLISEGVETIVEVGLAYGSSALAIGEALVAVDPPHPRHIVIDLYFLRKLVRPGGLIILDDDWAPSVRTAVRYHEQNLGWTPLPDAFADGTFWTVGRDPAAEAVPRCKAMRLPDPSFEPPFESFRPFW